MVSVVPLDAAHLEGWAALFEACHCSCYCRYWHFIGTTNDWLARTAFSADVNRNEHEQALLAGDPAARGLVALAGDAVVGWMKLVPRTSVTKLRKGRVYGALDLGADEGVYSIGCFLVHPEHREKGVARALVRGADDAVRAWGGRAVEAYPRRSHDELRPEEVWMGPEQIYIDAGYTHVAGEPPYPVYRKELNTQG
ncbi:GNAT family N-acetyltransferase [Pendulispora brunnea]|uniref:GNAT family N-acetyltransferase n=1 Tax=Pendulispora brunnea TaxID=2905690 RepID=A0ABZ2KMQ7_9BACT